MRITYFIIFAIAPLLLSAQNIDRFNENSFYFGKQNTLSLDLNIQGTMEPVSSSKTNKSPGLRPILFPRIEYMHASSNAWSKIMLLEYQSNSRSTNENHSYINGNQFYKGEVGTPLYQGLAFGLRFANHLQRRGGIAPASNHFRFGFTYRHIFASHDNVELKSTDPAVPNYSLRGIKYSFQYFTLDLGYTNRTMLSRTTFLDLTVELGYNLISLPNPYRDEIAGDGRLYKNLWEATSKRYKTFDLAKFQIGIGRVLGMEK